MSIVAVPSPLRIVFMGTPEFARRSLAALLEGPDRVVGVVCQPDRPRGRGLATTPPPVKELALAHALPVLQPERLRDPDFAPALCALAPDLIIVVAYGKILPRWVLDLPPAGCINVHASLLPRHRGAAPIQWALLTGDRETGVTIMAMSEEMDAGDILLTRTEPITPDDTAGSLTAHLAECGAAALVEALATLHARGLRAVPQPTAGITFAPRIEREHGRIDWNRASEEIARLVRAMAPTPGAFTTFAGGTLKIHATALDSGPSGTTPGTILEATPAGVVVACGAGALRILELQLEGRRRMSAGAFLAGHPIPPGTCLGG